MLKKLTIIILFLSMFIMGFSVVPAQAESEETEYKSEVKHLIVEIEESVDLSTITSVCKGKITRISPLNYITLETEDPDKEDVIKKVLKCSGVLSAEWSAKYKISSYNISSDKVIAEFSGSDPLYGQQWALKKIRANQVWEEGISGQGVTVAVLDTGIDYNCPDFSDSTQSNIVAGYNAITRSTTKESTQDDHGHGTSVAGVIAALNNDSGVVGIAYNAKIMPVKVMDKDGEGEDDIIADGIVWAANHGAKIINLSIGSETENKILDDALAYARSKGCLLVGASGNKEENGTNGISFPAANPNVLAVTSIDIYDRISDFALTGPEVQLTAPGERIITDIWSRLKSGVGTTSGTSIAAPFVSGTAALLWSEFPYLKADDIHRSMISSAYDLGTLGQDKDYGYGRLDAYRALKSLEEQKIFSSPASFGWEGGKIMLAGSSEDPNAVLTIPVGAFPFEIDAAGYERKINFSLEDSSSTEDFPAGIVPAGDAVSINPWGESPAEKPLALKIKLFPPLEQSLKPQTAWLYQWSDTRWIRVGGGFPESADSMEVSIYELGIYRAGWSPETDRGRFSGTDRIHTALEIAGEAFPTGTDTVIITRADNYPDALAGVPLAYKYHAPVLLTYPNELPAEVAQLIRDLAPKRIIILGGREAVSTSVQSYLQSMASVVTRIAGNDRYATATAIAGMLGTKGNATIVNGYNFPDAIAVASQAARKGTPILLVSKDSLNGTTSGTLRKLSVTSTKVVGGTGVIANKVLPLLPFAERIYGSDRYATSAAIIRNERPGGRFLYVATGLNFPDALTGGILAAAGSTDILLISPQGLTAVQISVLETMSGKKAVALGGKEAVSDKVLSQVQALIK